MPGCCSCAAHTELHAQPTWSSTESTLGRSCRLEGHGADAAARPHRQLDNVAHGPRAGAHVHANDWRRRWPRLHGLLERRLGRLRAQSRPRSASAVRSEQSQCKDHLLRSCPWRPEHTHGLFAQHLRTPISSLGSGNRTAIGLGGRRRRRGARRGSFGPCCCGGAACGAAARPPAARCSTARCVISWGTWAGMPAARRARLTTCAASAL